ncbi:sensor histidine kinase [Paenibacillus sp. IB182496]|uniref:Sensor histidine kinase n=1 Tax=Paenibacillus sabuli TaxID=2772509 RepID=A0A927GQG5_9BACL|nr:sensor histidine kinase [Paenibacillus sabuli]MBD2843870.1 sensor histidine kinase [Paenibacillus sabuli]
MRLNKRFFQSLFNFKFQSLFFRTLVFILLVFILPFVCLSVVIYSYMNAAFEEEITMTNLNGARQVREVIDNVFVEADRLATKLSLQRETEVFLVSPHSVHLLDGGIRNIDQTLSMFTMIYNHMDTIYVYSEVNDWVISNRDSSALSNFEDLTWYGDYAANEEERSFVVARKKNGKYPLYLSLVRPVYLFQSLKAGAVIVNMDMQRLGRLIQQSARSDSKEWYIVSADGEVYYHEDHDLFLTHLALAEAWPSYEELEQEGVSAIREWNGQQSVVSMVASKAHDWIYVSAQPLNLYEEKRRSLVRLLIVFVVIGSAVLFFVSLLIAYRTYAPVNQIMSVARRIDAPPSLSEQDHNELRYIIRAFEQTEHSKRLMEEELEERMAVLNKAQTAVLQAQITPHFLFNTLEMVKWMAIGLTRAPNAVSDIITALSHLMKISMNSDQYLIPIEEELEHARYYQQVMEKRFVDVLHIQWEIDPAIYRYKMVKLSLQPLLENAFYHGIKPLKRKGRVIVRGWKESGRICFEIEDEGVGMSAQTQAKVNATLAGEPGLSEEHIGIYNVHVRMRLVFGEPYGLSVRSEWGTGTTFLLSLPLLSDERAEDHDGQVPQ